MFSLADFFSFSFSLSFLVGLDVRQKGMGKGEER